MHKVRVTRFFEAAHKLADSEDLITKQCARLHGHTYHAIVTFDSKKTFRHGMTVDFRGIKDIIDVLDHRYINDIFSEDLIFQYEQPTAENIAVFIHEKIKKEYPDLSNLSVSICEGYKGAGHSSYVTYTA